MPNQLVMNQLLLTATLAAFVTTLPDTARAEHANGEQGARHRITKPVEFEYCSARVRSKGREALKAIAETWHEGMTITVEGHALAADEERSIALGQRRADRVRNYLVRYGVDAEAVVAIGHSRSEDIGRYVDLVIESR